MNNVEIYQANQIGGCVTVVSSVVEGRTHRVMIDYGCSLEGNENAADVHYPWEEKPVDAVFFTHYHGDHVGRLMEIPETIPVYMGATARKVMINIQKALIAKHDESESVMHKSELQMLQDDSRVHTFEWNGEERKYASVCLTGFTIEPYSVDHSAYDAYMFLIEADNPEGKKVILHTGDFRGHGRRGKAMIPVISKFVRKRTYSPKTKEYTGHPGRDVDILIIEGTMMNRDKEKVISEYRLQLEAAKYLRKHRYAFLICSSTNLDSLASFYQAAQIAASPFKRYLYTYSPYLSEQLKTFSETAGMYTDVYQFENVFELYLEKELKASNWERPMTQKALMERTGFLALIKPDYRSEKYIDAFMEDYRKGIINEKPVIIYSMWDGYVKRDGKAKKQDWIDFLDRQENEKGIEIKYLHTSGHADVRMIEKVIRAVAPKEAIMPMHTENAEGFRTLNIEKELQDKVITMKN